MKIWMQPTVSETNVALEVTSYAGTEDVTL